MVSILVLIRVLSNFIFTFLCNLTFSVITGYVHADVKTRDIEPWLICIGGITDQNE